MTKLLNLDQLNAKEVREVQIAGTSYTIKEMSVEDFIETTRVAEAMEKETSYAKQLQATVTLIKRAIPTIDQGVLMQLSLDQLRVLTAFIRGEDPAKLIGEQAEGNKAESQGNG